MTAFLTSRFPQIIAELAPAVGLAVHQGAKSIAVEAKSRAPVSPGGGDLRDAIHMESGGMLEANVVAGDDDVYYGHFVEFGTTTASPHPFLIPAAESQFDEVVGLVNASLKTL